MTVAESHGSGRSQAYPIERLPAKLPTGAISSDVDAARISAQVISTFTDLNSAVLASTVAWRDLCAMTGRFRTFHGSSSVQTAWKATSNQLMPTAFALMQKSSTIVRVAPHLAWIQARFVFKTRISSCSGLMCIAQEEDEWKIWAFSTILEQLNGLPHPDVLEPHLQTNGHANGCTTVHGEGTDFDCVVVGAGMAGLTVAGRLKALGVSCVNIEKNKEVGDNWSLRYEAVKRKSSPRYCQSH